MKYKIYLAMLSLILVACSDHESGPPPHGETGAAVNAVSITGNGLANAGPAAPVSGGPNLLGVTAPAGPSAAGRIENGLEGMAKANAGNFALSLSQVRTNLPKVTSVNDAAGYDQVELLAYAACSDLTVGGTPLMQSRYNVTVGGTIAANQTALVAAGVRMLDQHTAGLASQGPDAAQISTIFNNLVTAQAAVGTNTSKMAFMAVCIAANTAGAALLGM